MRSFFIILAFAVIFVSGSVISDISVEKSLTEMEEKIRKIETKEDLETTTEEWERLSDLAEIIIDHGDLEEISQALWAMEAEIQYDYDEFMESRQLAAQIISHIKDRNTIGVINIL